MFCVVELRQARNHFCPRAFVPDAASIDSSQDRRTESAWGRAPRVDAQDRQDQECGDVVVAPSAAPVRHDRLEPRVFCNSGRACQTSGYRNTGRLSFFSARRRLFPKTAWRRMNCLLTPVDGLKSMATSTVRSWYDRQCFSTRSISSRDKPVLSSATMVIFQGLSQLLCLLYCQ